MTGKTAGEVYKNIKVLKDVPADQLNDGMRYITVALGVRCDFCHNTKDFASDEKRPKGTARMMMTMLFAINKDNFKGRPAVGCYTCHQGHEMPAFAPMPAAGAAQTTAEPAPPMTQVEAKKIKLAPGAAMPTVDEVLAKYAEALGGEAALAKLTTREIGVDRTGENENAPAVEEEIYEQAPNKFLVVTHVRENTLRIGYDGQQAWAATPRGSRPLDAMDGLTPLRDAQIDPAAALAGYAAKRVAGMAQIGDQKTYVVTGQAPDGVREQLYFAMNSGLLLRRAFVYRTIFGPLLFQANYSDYRKEGDVEMPFRTEWWAGDGGFTETVKSVKTGVHIDDEEFQPPPKSAAGAGTGAR